MRESQIAKRVIIDDLKEKFERCASFVIIDYKGLTVEKDTEFRAEFRKANVEYKVLKNTLVRIALNELGYKDFDAALNGPTAIAISYDDAIAPAKVVSEGIDKYKVMSIKCGMMDKAYVDDKTVQALAKIPGKQVLYGMLANVLNAPIQGLAIALNAGAEKQGA